MVRAARFPLVICCAALALLALTAVAADKPAAEVGEFGQDSAMGRAAQPEELSPAFVFLASPVMSSYVNGIVLPVMGGPKG